MRRTGTDLHSPYRFVFLIQKAQEYAAKARELGAQRYSPRSKKATPSIWRLCARIRNDELSELQLAVKQDQWRDADWQVEALQKTKAVSQANFSYYKQLIQNGLITDEIAYQDMTIAATVPLRAAGDAIRREIASGVAIGPNTFSGAAGFGGSPLFYMQLPIGQSFVRGIQLRRAHHGRPFRNRHIDRGPGAHRGRVAATLGRVELIRFAVLTIEIEQVELQILGAQRRRNQPLCVN